MLIALYLSEIINFINPLISAQPARAVT